MFSVAKRAALVVAVVTVVSFQLLVVSAVPVLGDTPANVSWPVAVETDAELLQLAEDAKAVFRRRMEPPIIELTVIDIQMRDATALLRDLVRENYDAAIEALVAEAQVPTATARVKAALHQLVAAGRADLADAQFEQMAQDDALQGEAGKRKLAANLRHSVALVELPAALAQLIKLPSDSDVLTQHGEKAAPAFRRAAELEPDNPWTWITIAALETAPEAINQAVLIAWKNAQTTGDVRAMIVALHLFGLKHTLAGRPDLAERPSRDALALSRHWSAQAPTDATAQRYLARSLNRVGDALTQQRHHADAAMAYEEALSTADRLAEAAPMDEWRQIGVIAAHMNLFVVANAAGDSERARMQLQEAITIYNAVAARDPFRASYKVFQSGAVVAVLAAAGALTLIVAFVTLARYRRAIRRYMLAAASAAAASGAPASEYISLPYPGHMPTNLPLRTINVDTAPKEKPRFRSSALDGARCAIRRATWTYAIAGLTFAVASSALWLTFAGIELTWPRLAGVILGWSWPVIFTVALLWGPDRRRLAALVGVYLSVLLAFCIRMAFSSTPPLQVFGLTIAPFFQPLYFVALEAVPSLFLLLFLNRQVRAIGPLLLVLMIVVCTGTQIAMLAASTYAGLRVITWIGIPATATMWSIHLAGLLLFLPLGLLAIAGMRRRYDRKRFSDQTLVHDSVWLFQTGRLCLSALQNVGGRGWFAGAVFPVYKVIVWLGLRPLAAAAASRPPARLLLLRTFGFRRRTERFFDLLGARWRYAGPIQLISAPDFAGRSIDPDEFLDFLSGRLRRRFIIEPGDLDRRLAEMDKRPDPDGRFRVNELFCGNDAWRPAVRGLMTDSDMVVMDLRGFSTGNQGCLFELQSLIDIVPLARVVVLTDRTTDASCLEEALARCWQTMAAGSPNRKAAGALTVLEIGGRDVAAVETLLRIADDVLATGAVSPYPVESKPRVALTT